MTYEDSTAPPLTLDGDLPGLRADARKKYIDELIARDKEAYRAAFRTEGQPPDEESRVLAARTTAALVLLDVEETIGFALPHAKRNGRPTRHDPLVRLNWAELVEFPHGEDQEDSEFVHYEVRPTEAGLLALNGLRERLGMPSTAEERALHIQSLRQQAEEIQAGLPLPREGGGSG